jgi:hypothetical protein
MCHALHIKSSQHFSCTHFYPDNLKTRLIYPQRSILLNAKKNCMKGCLNLSKACPYKASSYKIAFTGYNWPHCRISAVPKVLEKKPLIDIVWMPYSTKYLKDWIWFGGAKVKCVKKWWCVKEWWYTVQLNLALQVCSTQSFLSQVGQLKILRKKSPRDPASKRAQYGCPFTSTVIIIGFKIIQLGSLAVAELLCNAANWFQSTWMPHNSKSADGPVIKPSSIFQECCYCGYG